MTMRLAALLVEYRSPARTTECASALLSQGVDEVLIVDNSDDGGKTLASLRASWRADAKVRVVDSGANLGFAAGVNHGLERLSADRVLLINNDALPEPNLVSGLVDAIESDVEAQIAFPTLQHAGQTIEEVFYHRWSAALLSRPFPGAFRVPRGCCMLIARDRMPPGALFDEAFFMYGEEIALGWRLRDRPRALLHVPACRVVHEGSAAAGRGSRFYEERTATAHLLLTDRLARHRLEAPFLSASRGIALVVRAIARAMRAGNPMPILALFSAVAIARGHKSAGTPPPR